MTLAVVGTRVGADGHTGKLVMIGGVKCVVIRYVTDKHNRLYHLGVMTEFGRIIHIYYNYNNDGSYTCKANKRYFISVEDSVANARCAFQSQAIGNVAYNWENFLNSKVRQQYIDQVKRSELENQSYQYQCKYYGERSYTYGT